MFKGNFPGAALTALVVLSLAMFAGVASASDAGSGMGGSGLQWETALQMISRSISGPFAFAAALIGLVACCAKLIMGGEISDFLRTMIYMVMVICVLIFANRFLTGVLFSGAVIP
jgi:type IV secretion system protein VirB2